MDMATEDSVRDRLLNVIYSAWTDSVTGRITVSSTGCGFHLYLARAHVLFSPESYFLKCAAIFTPRCAVIHVLHCLARCSYHVYKLLALLMSVYSRSYIKV